MSVLVVLPWREGCEHRARALRWVLDRYAAAGLDTVVAPHDDGPWNKARAAWPELVCCDAEIVVVADADVWAGGLPAAIAAVRDGAPWAIPHRAVYRLSSEATDRVLVDNASLLGLDELGLARRPYVGYPGGGIVVTTPAVARSVPLDPRFEGWGQEDESWGLALHTLAGAAHRVKAPLVHLWHPPAPRLDARVGSTAGWNLAQRYHLARGNVSAMRDLIREAHVRLSPHDAPLRDPAPHRAGLR